MSQSRRIVLGLLGTVLIAAVLSVVMTILLLPLWRWLEASTGIESVGHSGPAEWCYAAVFLVLAAGGAIWLLTGRRAKAGG